MSDPTNITTSDNNSEDLSKKEILSIRNDYVFKRIFSNRAILASFLSAYLGIKISEDEVLIENPLIGPIEYKGKPSLPDLKVTIRINSETYGRFDIEMQTTCNEYLWKRFLHSACKMYAEQIIEGDKYTKLNNTFTLIIYSCNFIKEDDACCHIYSVNDPVYNIAYKHSFQIHTIELPKRNTLFENKHLKNNKNLKELSKWLDFFSSNTEEEYMNAAGECVEMQDAFKMIKVMSMDKDERGMADAAMYARANEAAMYDEGYENGKQEMVINLLHKNFSISEIADISGFSPERINKIKADLK